MRITSELICQAADQLNGFVGFNRKTAHYIVRFSEDSFGMDVADDAIIPASEFVWACEDGQTMTLKRELIRLLLEQISMTGSTSPNRCGCTCVVRICRKSRR